MGAKKRWKLEAAGWRVGTAADFLDLTSEESALIDVKASLGRLVRAKRESAKISQQGLAARIHSSQSRVAKAEAGDASVSLDLIFKAAPAAGAKRSEVAREIRSAPGSVSR
jgi:ribosome-binding protein aMBF1 (putative translation factor)